MACIKCSSKGIKICLVTTILLILVVIIVSSILFFTIFKPKQPQVTFQPVSLEHIELKVFPTLQLNITLGVVIRIHNPNYGSFKFKNTTSFVNYHETVVAEVPIEHENVPARGTLNMYTSVEIFADKLISSPYFLGDVEAGSLNLTSTATLHGKVGVLKILKMGAMAFSVCNISVLIQAQYVESKCKSKIKL